MAGESRTYPLLEAAIRRSGLSRSWTIVIIAVVQLLLLVLMAFLDGSLSSISEWSTVGPSLLYIGFSIYILVVYPFMLRSREQAVLAFKPLLSLEDDAFNKVAENTLKPNRRGEWTAIFVGIAVLGGVLFQPWTLDWTSGYFWASVFEVITTIIGMTFMAWLVYDTLAGIVRISRLSRQELNLDILDSEMMAPVASWSLGISLVFVGIFVLSIISDVTDPAEIAPLWRDIVGYGFLICSTLLIFFLSMWSVHRALSKAKKSKLIPVRTHLTEISRELEDRVAKGQREGMMELSSIVNALANYEKRINETPTWPFNAGIIRRLLLSIVTPGLVYLVKILSQVGIRFDF